MNNLRRTTAVGVAGLMAAGIALAGGAPANAAYPPKPQLPLTVKPKNKTTYNSGTWNTIITTSFTSNQGVVKRSVVGTSLRPSAAGEVRFIRTRITRKGGVQVKVVGTGPVRVKVRMRAIPKPKFKGDVRASKTFKRTWTLRPN